MKMRKLAMGVATAVAVAGGMVAAGAAPALALGSPTALSDTPTSAAPVSTDYSYKVNVPPGTIRWQFWGCETLGQTISHPVVVDGPHALTKNWEWVPVSGTTAPYRGFGKEVYNMSNTEATWIQVSYTCTTTPPPDTTMTLEEEAVAVPHRDKNYKMSCPIDHPYAVSASYSGEGPNFRITQSIDHSSLLDTATFLLDNDSSTIKTAKMKLVCDTHEAR